jgi:uncharacterized oxidoreductase
MALRDSTILVTGGTSGIGRALAVELDRAGHQVIICGRRVDRLTEVRQRSPRIVTRTCDLADAGQRQDLVDWLVQRHPELNVLVNNAGLQLPFDATRPVDVDRVRREVELNLVAPLHLSSLLAGHFAGRVGATVVNISSGLAFTPLAEVGFYSATKAALHSLTLTMRHQFAPLGVRVVEIAPPAVDTELGAERRADPGQSHGGMPVAEFVAQALTGLESGADEIMVGGAARMRAAPWVATVVSGAVTGQRGRVMTVPCRVSGMSSRLPFSSR